MQVAIPGLDENNQIIPWKDGYNNNKFVIVVTAIIVVINKITMTTTTIGEATKTCWQEWKTEISET